MLKKQYTKIHKTEEKVGSFQEAFEFFYLLPQCTEIIFGPSIADHKEQCAHLA